VCCCAFAAFAADASCAESSPCGCADVTASLCCARQVMPIMLYNPGKIPAFSREARPTHLSERTSANVRTRFFC
jgi:hypothetical protein